MAQPNHLARIETLLHEPYPPDHDVLGFHVTSVQALGHAAATGRFPTSGAFGDVVYFAAPLDLQTSERIPLQQARDWAQWYGIANARTWHILEPYRADAMDMLVMHNLMMAVSMDAFDDPSLPTERRDAVIWKEMRQTGGIAIGAALGLTKQEMFEAIVSSEPCRGVALTLPTRLANEFAIGGGDDPDQPFDYDFRVVGGLSLSHVSRIELLGEYEEQRFAAISAP